MDWLAPFWETCHIVFFVMIVMMLMEFWELYRMRCGRGRNPLISGGSLRYGWQLLLSGLMGFVPGCVGGFMVVSLYTHRAVSFGAVIAVSFTALGDDAFRMLALEPLSTLWIELLLLPLGLGVGFLADKLSEKRSLSGMSSCCRVEWHEDDGHRPAPEHSAAHPEQEGRNGLVPKVLLSFLLAGCFIWQVRCFFPGRSEACSVDVEQILLSLLTLAALGLVLSANRHFLQEHLWNHLLKKHFLSLFLWTLATLYLLAVLQYYTDMQAWIANDVSKLWLLLAAALLVGWIPQSGPHFLFIQLYFSGTIPFSVFFANAIVQDGHTSLLLLAESRRKFILLKSVKSIVAIVVGGLLLLC